MQSLACTLGETTLGRNEFALGPSLACWLGLALSMKKAALATLGAPWPKLLVVLFWSFSTVVGRSVQSCVLVEAKTKLSKGIRYKFPYLTKLYVRGHFTKSAITSPDQVSAHTSSSVRGYVIVVSFL